MRKKWAQGEGKLIFCHIVKFFLSKSNECWRGKGTFWVKWLQALFLPFFSALWTAWLVNCGTHPILNYDTQLPAHKEHENQHKICCLFWQYFSEIASDSWNDFIYEWTTCSQSYTLPLEQFCTVSPATRGPGQLVIKLQKSPSMIFLNCKAVLYSLAFHFKLQKNKDQVA